MSFMDGGGGTVDAARARSVERRIGVYKFQSRGSTAVKKHNRLSILKCSDVLHYNKNVTRGLCVRGNIIVRVYIYIYII